MLSPSIYLRWAVFRSLEAAALAWGRIRFRKRHSTQVAPSTPRSEETRLWIFASTIGELNAIAPFLAALLAEAGTPPLLLLSDHAHYRDSFLRKFPEAEFVHLNGGSAGVVDTVRRFPPRALMIAEIPCILFDAPCRFSFAVVYELKRRRVPVCVVNGWLYRYATASRLDAIEKRLFDRIYLELIDLFLVQTEAAKRELVDRGAASRSVIVIGNIKFDAKAPQLAGPAAANVVLRSIRASGRPCIVAGCVTNLPDQEAILDAFRDVLAKFPLTLLVIAPRHPEVEDRMRKLESFLRTRELTYAFKSRLGEMALPAQISVLVLDTMGELMDFYALATLTYVGPNHNVLEPLILEKPVFVLPGWDPTYPSYPVYRLMLAQGAITEAAGSSALARDWTEMLGNTEQRESRQARIRRVLTGERGATRRALDALEANGFIQQARTAKGSATSHPWS
jgi:3-deoxy-D-manno-octulosonic-acid transferase